jgi:hypothetical protein
MKTYRGPVTSKICSADNPSRRPRYDRTEASAAALNLFGSRREEKFVDNDGLLRL